MQKNDLLKNETIESILSPHPLSFMKLQSLCIFVMVWGVVIAWLVNFSQFRGVLASNPWFPVALWGLVLLLGGVVISLITIRWSVFFLYLAVFAGGVALLSWQNLLNQSALFIPFYSAAAAIAGFLIVEVYRRSHKYVITSMRIIFSGGVLTKRERIVRYDKISDIDTRQGILGQIFGFGTIIPVTQSGLGLGSDKSFAAAGAAGGGRLKLFGLFGGGRDVQTPRARSYYELHGVYPFREVKKTVENMVQGSVPTAYQKEQVEFHRQQVDIQKQMRDLLKQQVGGGRPRKAAAAAEASEDEVEEEEAPMPVKAKKKRPVNVVADDDDGQVFGTEQVDVQQQMKELLKKQRMLPQAPAEDAEAEEESDEDQDSGKSVTA